MQRRGVVSLVRMARRWPVSPASSFVMFVALAVVMSTSAFAPPLAAAPPAKRQTPAAPAGARPVNRALPAGTATNHGYPKGSRPPVVPPGVPAAGPQRKLSAAQWAAVPKPGAKPAAEPGVAPKAGPATVAATGDTGATGLVLRSGFDFNDTSLVLYFNAADPGISGWSSWQATVFDPATGAAQDSRVLQPSDAKVCQVPAQYCRSFGSADGWSLVGGQQYFVTITVTFKDGTQVTSPASAQAAARTTTDPPAVPNAQLAGCGCSNSLFPTTVVQATRGSGVATGIGSYASVWPDLQLAGFGVTFASVRTYDSANTTAGVLGVGWAWS